MLTRDQFEAARREICPSGPPSTGVDLWGMEIDFCVCLGARADQDRCPWHDLTVSRCEGAEWLITGSGHGRSDDADAIALGLRRIWQEELRYSYREAHTIVQASDELVLLAVTQIGPRGFWVTANVTLHLGDQ